MSIEKVIEQIKQRILDEQRKHKDLDWAEIAARKIYHSHCKTRWGAYYLPASNYDKTKEGFKSEEDALDYVDSFACDDCKKGIRNDACGSEWVVDIIEDYKEVSINNERE